MSLARLPLVASMSVAVLDRGISFELTSSFQRSMSLPSVPENAEKTPEQAAAEKTNSLLEANNLLLERQVVLLEKINKNLGFLNDKATNAEMRQCQVSGEGTDASRMTAFWLQAESALWSETHKRLIFDKIYEAGDTSSIVYKGIFLEKDKRRAEYTVAYFYVTFNDDKDELIKALEPDGAEGNALAKYMPCFRNELLEDAKQRDRDKINGRHGPHELRMESALGELPPELKSLLDLCLPLDKKYRPVPVDGLESDVVDVVYTELYSELPQQIKFWIEYAATCFGYGHDLEIRHKVSRAIVDWTCYTEYLKNKLHEHKQKMYEIKCHNWHQQSVPENEQEHIEITKRWATENLTSHRQLATDLALAEGTIE